jgi:undecaprenyl-diphosphatase
VLQGLGEFLPISSSGHLIVVPWMLGWPAQSLAFDVALHLGTLAAVVYAFLGEWLTLARGGFAALRSGRPLETAEGRLLVQLVVASIPAAVAGILLDDWADTTFRSPGLVAVTMAAMGIALFVADRRSRPALEGAPLVPVVSHRDALLIGCAQALALVPGVSRSGATISAGLMRGIDRVTATRLSFFLGIPALSAAGIYEAITVRDEITARVGWLPTIVGLVVSFVVAYASIAWLLRYVARHSIVTFVWYRVTLGALIIVAVGTGMLAAT